MIDTGFSIALEITHRHYRRLVELQKSHNWPVNNLPRDKSFRMRGRSMPEPLVKPFQARAHVAFRARLERHVWITIRLRPSTLHV